MTGSSHAGVAEAAAAAQSTRSVEREQKETEEAAERERLFASLDSAQAAFVTAVQNQAFAEAKEREHVQAQLRAATMELQSLRQRGLGFQPAPGFATPGLGTTVPFPHSTIARMPAETPFEATMIRQSPSPRHGMTPMQSAYQAPFTPRHIPTFDPRYAPSYMLSPEQRASPMFSSVPRPMPYLPLQQQTYPHTASSHQPPHFQPQAFPLGPMRPPAPSGAGGGGGGPSGPPGGGGGGGGGGGDGGDDGGHAAPSGVPPPTGSGAGPVPASRPPPPPGGGPPDGSAALSAADMAAWQRDRHIVWNIDLTRFAPRFTKGTTFDAWRSVFINWAEGHRVEREFTEESPVFHFAASHAEAQFMRTSIALRPIPHGAHRPSDADLFDLRLRANFAYQALNTAVRGHSTQVDQIMNNVPAPNSFLALNELQKQLRPLTIYSSERASTAWSMVRQKASESFADWVNRFISTRNEYHTYGGTTTESDAIIRLLSTTRSADLPMHRREHILGKLNAYTTLADVIAEITSLISASHPNESNREGGSHALMAESSRRDKTHDRCNKCGKFGHWESGCPSNVKKGRQNKSSSSSSSSSSSRFKSGEKKGKGGKSKGKGQPSHLRTSNLPTTKGATCSYCGKKNHTMEQCKARESGLPKPENFGGVAEENFPDEPTHSSTFMMMTVEESDESDSLEKGDLEYLFSLSPFGEEEGFVPASSRVGESATAMMIEQTPPSGVESALILSDVDAPTPPCAVVEPVPLPEHRTQSDPLPVDVVSEDKVPVPLVTVAVQPVNASLAEAIASQDGMGDLVAVSIAVRHGFSEGIEVMIDSGANRHMVRDPSLMTDTRPSDIIVRTAAGDTMKSPVCGTVKLYTSSGQPLLLRDVLHHPMLSRNLLSLSRLCDMPEVSKAEVDSKEIRLFSRLGRLVLSAKNKGGLYITKLSTSPSPTEVHVADHGVYRLMHDKFGHIGFTKLHLLMNSKAAKGLPNLKPSDATGCDTCKRAKLSARPFKIRVDPSLLATRPLDRVHMDLVGPVQTPSFNGARTLLVIIDEFSRFSWVYPIKSKDLASPRIKQWVNEMHTQYGRYPKEIHTDRGGEFLSEDLKGFYKNRGIVDSQTLPYTPQHNGMVERFNRTIIEMTRANLLHANAPKAFWAEAVTASCHVANRVIIRKGDKFTPVQLFTGKFTPIDLNYINPWGCDVFVKKTPGQGASGKFDAVADKMSFVGYDSPVGFRCFTMKNGKLTVISSRNVSFNPLSFSAMREVAEEFEDTELADDENDEDFFSSLALRNELRLMKEVSAAPPPVVPEDDERKETIPSSPSSPLSPTSPSSAPPAPPSIGSPPPSRPSRGAHRDLSTQLRSPSAPPPSRPSRVTHPPMRYGMIDPRDIGLGHAAEVSAFDPANEIRLLEDDFTFFAFGEGQEEVNAATRQRVKMLRDVRGEVEDLALASRREQERARSISAAETNQPYARDRPLCNRRGEIVMPSQRCTADNKQGEQCRARTRSGRYCWIHLRALTGLRIKQSTVPGAGRGLFAARDFGVGDHVSKYTGDIFTGAPWEPDEFGGSSYAFQISHNFVIDAARTNSAPGRFANDTIGSSKHPNLKWVVDRRNRQVRLVTTRHVKAGDEFFVSYGAGYRKMLRKAAAAPTKSKEHRPHIEFEITSSDEEHKYDSPSDSPRDEEESKGSATYVASSTSSSSLPPPDPFTYAQAMASEHKAEWEKAMMEEQKALTTNKVYSVVESLPPGHRALETKWVFKLKEDGRFKARLVARGFRQEFGRDYFDTYAPVIAYATLRLLFAFAAHHDFEVHMMDVITAYLNALLPEEIYISTPPGFVGPEKGKFLRLHRALYGLKQAGRYWNHTLVDVLIGIGYRNMEFGDVCVMLRMSRTKRPLIFALFVDDMPHLFHRLDAKEMAEDKMKLSVHFKFKDLGPASKVLGFYVSRDRSKFSISLSQRSYVLSVLKQFGHEHVTPFPVPTAKGTLTTKKVNHGESSYPKVTIDNYRSAVGSLMYAANATRPDIAYAVGFAARDCANPTDESVAKVKRILRYLAGTAHLDLVYTRQPHPAFLLFSFSDSDFAGDLTDRKSTTGQVHKLAGAAVHWSSTKQPSVALSTSEAEYIAASEAARSLVHLRVLLAGIGCAQEKPTLLIGDNTVAIAMVTDEGRVARRKHIDVIHHFIRDKAKQGYLEMKWTPTSRNEADLFTKALPHDRFALLRSLVMGHTTASPKVLAQLDAAAKK